MSEILYEIYSYDTEEDFEAMNISFIDGCYTSMSAALKVVESEKFLDDYAVVKVQSLDREEIEVLRKNGATTQ